jgi:hypothetical protein
MQEAAHYQDNTALKEAGVGANQVAVVGGSSALAGGVGGLSGSGSASTAGASEAEARTPLYYNGRVPAYCLVTVEGEEGLRVGQREWWGKGVQGRKCWCSGASGARRLLHQR